MAKATTAFGLLAGLGFGLALSAQAPPPKAAPPAANPDVFVLGAPAKPPAAVAPAPAAVKRLPDPGPAQIQHIIDVFTAKERMFRELLAHDYVYTETINMQELDDDGNPVGNFRQTNEINYTPNGAKQIVCTFCPQPSLKNLVMTEDDLNDMFNMNMYTLSVDELPQYNVAYVDHEPLDQITAYVFSVAPKEIVKDHRYFQGKVYVDDHDLMIVKSAGKVVPDQYDKHGNVTNYFPPFQVWRQQIDGKYWFPVYTLMQGAIPATKDSPALPLRMVIQYSKFKQFRATTRILSFSALPDGTTPKPDDKDKKKPPPPTIPHNR